MSPIHIRQEPFSGEPAREWTAADQTEFINAVHGMAHRRGLPAPFVRPRAWDETTAAQAGVPNLAGSVGAFASLGGEEFGFVHADLDQLIVSGSGERKPADLDTQVYVCRDWLEEHDACQVAMTYSTNDAPAPEPTNVHHQLAAAEDAQRAALKNAMANRSPENIAALGEAIARRHRAAREA